jgi:hypothetical protein
MNKELSQTQVKALSQIQKKAADCNADRRNGEVSSAELCGVSIATVNALAKKGAIKITRSATHQYSESVRRMSGPAGYSNNSWTEVELFFVVA